MKIKGIIFDADGPLYYREKIVDNLKMEALKKFGYTGNYEEFKESYEKEKWLGYVRTLNTLEMFNKMLKNIGLDLDRDALNKFVKEFLEIQRNVSAVEGATESLKELKEKGIKICVLTDTFFPENEKWNWFKNIKMDKHIDIIVCSYDIKHLKDSEEAYKECLKKMKLKPSEVVFVGHKQYEMDGAKKANITSIAILPISEEKIKANYKIQSIKELPELIPKIK